MSNRHVLVTGATGLVGRAAMEYFARAGVRTTAVSRRRPFDTYDANFLSVDLSNEAACRAAFADLSDVTQLVFAALHEEPDLVSGWTDPAQIDRNDRMLRNTVEAIAPVAKGLRNITILQGPKAYGAHVHKLRPSAREGRDEDRSISNFYWVQEDYLQSRQRGQDWGWTIFRPSMVLGMAIGSPMNLLAAFGVYGAVLKARGEPLHFPGPPDGLLQASDTDVMARAFDWAGTADEAQNQIFNITDGEMCSFADQWAVIADALGMKVGEERPVSLMRELLSAAGEWDAICQRHDLLAPSLERFIGQSARFAEGVLMYSRRRSSGTISDIKLRRAGFNETIYADEMLSKWFARYQDARLLPRR